MLLMCAVKERVLLRMVPRLLIWGEGWTIELSIGNKKTVKFGRFSTNEKQFFSVELEKIVGKQSLNIL